MGPKNHVLRGGQIPHGNGHFRGVTQTCWRPVHSANSTLFAQRAAAMRTPATCTVATCSSLSPYWFYTVIQFRARLHDRYRVNVRLTSRGQSGFCRQLRPFGVDLLICSTPLAAASPLHTLRPPFLSLSIWPVLAAAAPTTSLPHIIYTVNLPDAVTLAWWFTMARELG